MIRVAVADDHNLVRQGIRTLIDNAEDIEVIAEAEDGQEAINMVVHQQPDVLVIDITMPGMNGILATEEIREMGLSTEVVILSMHISTTLVNQALKAGALGYVLKKSVTSELLLAIRFASRGQQYLCKVASTYAGTEETEEERYGKLTLRERQILQLIAEGETNAEIAGTLSLSIKTIEKHRANLVKKLDVREPTKLVQIALKYGLITLED